MMKRYRVGEFVEPPIEERDGEWVRYSDHVDALRGAREAERKQTLKVIRTVPATAAGADAFRKRLIEELYRAAANSEEGAGDG